ncbi:DNA-binding protein [Nitrospira tepida]|uniref:DNA-binding protein n=1 Tax=Nitrospira tepida TaxID=2973512 RepID=A0AA86MWG7_9BACT|nr:helix-turn-helix domain-containing protein [Nitrospira tepida]CAI4030241.1 DNA-binding protein [Nitrospira tepida]
MLLTIRDLSRQLQIKPATLYAWAAAGKIPCLKIHGVLRFDPKAVQEWLTSFAVRCEPFPLQLELQEQGDSVDELIARAKRAVYTSRRGRPDQDRANGKEIRNGSV